MQKVKEIIEIKQEYIYFIALILGALLGMASLSIANFLESLISFLIAILMFGMFTQIPFLKLKREILNFKYILALVISNFIFIPILIFLLVNIFNISSIITITKH